MKKLWTMTDKEHKSLVAKEKYDKLQKQIDDSTEVVMEIAGSTKNHGCAGRYYKPRHRRSYCNGCKFARICTYKNQNYETYDEPESGAYM